MEGEGGIGNHEEGEKSPASRVDWVRKGRDNVDLTKIPVGKLNDAAERGIRVDNLDAQGGRVTGSVNKEIVEGLPSVPDRRL